jgi:hypothetical protein
MKICTSCLIDT